jgi:hypothetical protein
MNLHYDNSKSSRTRLSIGLSPNSEGFYAESLWARLK